MDEAALHVIPHIWERQKLLLSFATAVARSHPDPNCLLRALEQTLLAHEDDEIPMEERSAESQQARLHYHELREMFVSILKKRALLE